MNPPPPTQLGMWHDFDKRHGGDGSPGTGGSCEGQGTMSYGDDSPSRWSECSRKDFRAHYNQVLDKARGQWCLPAADRNFECSNNVDCGGDSGSAGNVSLFKIVDGRKILLLHHFCCKADVYVQ